LPPLARFINDRGPGIEIAGHPFHIGIDQQIDRVVVDIGREPVLDGADETLDAAFVEPLDEALRIGTNGRRSLAVEQSGGEPPQKHRQRGRTDGQQDRIDKTETKPGRAKETCLDHAVRRKTGRRRHSGRTSPI